MVVIMIDHSDWKNKLSNEQLTAFDCIILAQMEIFTNGDTEHNLAIRKVIRKIADKYEINPNESYRLL